MKAQRRLIDGKKIQLSLMNTKTEDNDEEVLNGQISIRFRGRILISEIGQNSYFLNVIKNWKTFRGKSDSRFSFIWTQEMKFDKWYSLWVHFTISVTKI